MARNFTVHYGVLAGKHVVVEPIRPDHAEGVLVAGGHREDWKYLPIPGFSNAADARAWVEQALELYEQRLHFTFVLLDPQTSTVIGSSRYLNVRERDRGLEIGYTWLARSS